MVAQKGRWRGGEYRLSPSLVQLFNEANKVAPFRRRDSDGSVGDLAHQTRVSDHNPQESGAIDWIDGLDITHDPANGMDIHARLREVARNVQSGIETRVSYLISKGEIFSQRSGVWAWRKYTGSSPHNGHGHISVKDSGRAAGRPWLFGTPLFPTAGPPPYIPSIPQPDEDDMASSDYYIEDVETTRIWHFYGENFRWIGAEVYKYRHDVSRLPGNREIVPLKMNSAELERHARKGGFIEDPGPAMPS